MLYNRISQEYQRLCQQIVSLQAELADYPAGQLVCCHQGTRCKWYHSDGHSRTYIPKRQRSYAEQLAAKKYLECLLKDLTEEKEALQSYLKKHPTTQSRAEKLLNEIPAYSELLSPYFKTDEKNLLEWQNSPYEKNQNYPEGLIHKASNRSLVRSKSEAMIDMVLYSHRIPFRYECALYLGNHSLFPDFTIRHPKTGETFYWEHFGMMDDVLYAQNTASKLQLYISHGIIPSIHLITTYETKDHPLSIEVIQNPFAQYLNIMKVSRDLFFLQRPHYLEAVRSLNNFFLIKPHFLIHARSFEIFETLRPLLVPAARSSSTFQLLRPPLDSPARSWQLFQTLRPRQASALHHALLHHNATALLRHIPADQASAKPIQMNETRGTANRSSPILTLSCQNILLHNYFSVITGVFSTPSSQIR